MTDIRASDSRLIGRACHPACVACRSCERGGLGLQFESRPDGSVVAGFPCHPYYQGYPDRLHGGVIATLLDAAMTHWLFSRGIRGYTGRLSVRFRHPVTTGQPAVVRAWLVRQAAPLYMLEAELTQGDRLCAAAAAKFLGEPFDGRVG